MYSNPYDIVESIDFFHFVEKTGASLPFNKTIERSWMEKIYSLSFWPLVGLKFFTWPVEMYTHFDRKEYKSSCEKFMQYMNLRIENGFSLQDCFLLSYIFFSAIAIRMSYTELQYFGFTFLPSGLLHIVKTRSIKKGREKVSEDQDIILKKPVFHFTVSLMCVLCRYYQIHPTEISIIKEYTSIANAIYYKSRSMEYLMKESLPEILSISGVHTLEDVFNRKDILETFSNKILDKEAKELFDRYCFSGSETVLQNIQLFFSDEKDDK